MDNTFPRRFRAELKTVAELKITEVMHEVENLGADERLTKAVVLLEEVKNLVGDYVDERLKKFYLK